MSFHDLRAIVQDASIIEASYRRTEHLLLLPIASICVWQYKVFGDRPMFQMCSCNEDNGGHMCKMCTCECVYVYLWCVSVLES